MFNGTVAISQHNGSLVDGDDRHTPFAASQREALYTMG